MNRFHGILALLWCLHLQAADAPTKRARLNEFYTVVPMAATPQMDTANWMVTDQAAGNPTADTAAALIAHFKKMPAKEQKDGMFIYSATHSIELTDKKQNRLPQRQQELLNDKVWRAAENKLVDELVAAANKEGIPVWVLFRATGELHTYKLLTDPKLTLKK
jgi:hypothetical protein